MLNQSAFDAPQTLAPAPSFHWPADDLKQAACGIVSEVRRGGESVFSIGTTYEQIRPSRDVPTQFRTLQQHYTVLGSDRRVIEVLEQEAALFSLLLEAVEPLRIAFGEKRLLQIRVQCSDDDRLLKVAVQLPADFGSDPETALRSFDRAWWLNNCHRSGGVLVFDYEIQDAV
jgi:hypothetical protein